MKKSQKLELVKTMDKIIRNYGGDDDLIFWWLQEGVPDCASEEDYKFIAYNATEFNDLVQLFIDIVKEFENYWRGEIPVNTMKGEQNDKQ